METRAEGMAAMSGRARHVPLRCPDMIRLVAAAAAIGATCRFLLSRPKVWANASGAKRVNDVCTLKGNEARLGTTRTKWTCTWEFHWNMGDVLPYLIAKKNVQNHLEIPGCQTNMHFDSTRSKKQVDWGTPSVKTPRWFGARLRHREENNRDYSCSCTSHYTSVTMNIWWRFQKNIEHQSPTFCGFV